MVANVVNRFGASFAQQRLWLLDQYEPGTSIYNLSVAWRVRGSLAVDVLTRSIDEVVRRHEALRTTLVSEGGEPTQVVTENVQVKPTVLDLSRREDSEAVARRLIDEEAHRPFDLARGPLIRVHLILLGQSEQILLLTLHHVIADGWSMGVLVREVGTTYRAINAGRAPTLTELPIQYADYAAWQRQWLQGAVLQKQLDYWKRTLDGSAPLLELPTDRPRPASLTHAGAAVQFDLGRELSDKVRQLSRNVDATLFMTIAAAFNVLLQRYTGQSDICIGFPTANRGRAELEGLIGFFVNTLVLRTRLNSQDSFLALLAQVREAVLNADAHQDIPFERLVQELHPARNLSRTPLFQVMLALNNTSESRLEVPGLTLEPLLVDSRTSKFELTLDFQERDQQLFGVLEYNTDLFDRSTIERMAAHFRTLLEAAVANPRGRVKELPLLTEAERQRILFEWNDTAVEYPSDKCVHELFEEQVEKTPEAVAVVFEDQQLTYAQLNAEANQLAHHLRELGVKPDALVAICVERGLEMVIGLLGILKAGGAYVPLDPGYPKERLAYMLADAAPRLLLTQHRLAPQTGGHNTLLCLDADWQSRIAPQPTSNPTTLAKPESLAYVIYTSGSTGHPKGVMVDHRGVCNVLSSFKSQLSVSREDCLLAVTTFSFDIAGLELYMPLSCGARLVVLSKEASEDAGLLAKAIDSHQATLMQATPATWRMMLHGKWFRPRRLRALCGGEALPKELSRKLSECVSELWNVYGPTETTIWSCSKHVQCDGTSTIESIGRPIGNTQIFLLDSELEPVPVGVAGELYIAGKGLARGYLNRAELTAERFIPDPFGDPGSRMYRTGDLGRYLPDGSIEFLGRVDHQVKIRGHRIELGEVESALNAHEDVREAVVVAREYGPGDKRLVGYVVAKEPGRLTIDVLQAHLQRSLPQYMVPSVWTFLTALPLTPNGKVDRNALPDPDTQRTRACERSEPPRNRLEQQLVEVWGEVLGLERVGIHDDFFELGGHSLLAAQAIARIRDVLNVDVALRALFKAPSPALMAKQLIETHEAGMHVPVIRKAQYHGQVACSFAQQRLWFIDQYELGAAHYNIPVAWRIHGEMDVSALHQSLRAIVQRHEVLRTALVADGETTLQVIAEHVEVDLPLIELSDSSEAEALMRQLVEQEAQRPFNLAQGPLFRASLLRMAPRVHVLQLTMHHAVSDGWSIGVLTRELAALYAAFSRGHGSPLAPLAVQYADYAVWQREWMQGEVLERQVEYWRRALEGAPPLLNLPLDRPRSALQIHRRATVDVAFDAEVVARFHQLCQKAQATTFMGLAALFNVLLHRHSRQEDICIGYPVAGRRRKELEPLIGFFVNTLVLRTRINPNASFAALLEQTREAVLDADAHQDVPFERLVEELNPERSPSYSPFFQAMLHLDHTGLELPELAGLDVVPIRLDDGIAAKFELTMHLTEYRGEKLSGVIEFDADLFDRSTIERMAAHFRTLLEAAVANPRGRVKELPLLTEAERQRILFEWNDTAVEYPSDKCVHELFEEQVEKTPEAVAVVFEDQQLTYAQLNAEANQLAHHLRELGVKPDALVAICVERGLEMVIGLLGILKAGGAYMPLDSGYPKERLAYMLADARPAILLTQRALLAELPAAAAVHAICMDTPRSGPHPERHTNLQNQSRPEHLAYVVYTSGSTGQPKGVCVCRRALLNRILWSQADFPCTAGSKHLHSSSASFTDSITSMLSALVFGAQLHVASSADMKDVVRLAAMVRDRALARMVVVPSLLQAMVSSPECTLDSVSTIVVSGEKLESSLIAQAKRALKPGALTNFYGCSEITGDATAHRVIDWSAEHEPESIGRPISNTQIYIVDDNQQPTPIGVAGELYIAGAGLARCYLGHPSLTAEKFVPNPFGPPGSRMYKTGDWARHLANGNIEYLGRLDHQVKIRGFRVELGEIESALMSHQGVCQAVVVTEEHGLGTKRLAAYVIPARRGELRIESLRTFLQQTLPRYMVPTRWVLLDKLPLTPVGKIDRLMLQTLLASRGEPSIEHVAPRTPTESRLALIWKEMLQLEEVSVLDNFFDIGGHSLNVVELRLRIRQEFSRTLPVKTLYSVQTIASQAIEIDSAPTTGDSESDVQCVGLKPLTPAQQRFLATTPVEHQRTNVLQMLLSSRQPLERVASAVRRLVKRHGAFYVEEFVKHDDGWSQRFGELGACKLVEAVGALSREQFIESALALRDQIDHNGNVFSLWYFGSVENLTYVYFACHHLICDGVSLGILQLELDLLLAGEDICLPRAVSLSEWVDVHASPTAAARYVVDLPLWERSVDKNGECGGFFAWKSGRPACRRFRLDGGHGSDSHDNRTLLSAAVHAFGQTFCASASASAIPCRVVDSGRRIDADLDDSLTIGWLAHHVPYVFEIGATVEDTFASTASLLSAPQARGLGYGWLRYQHSIPTLVEGAQLTDFPLYFNHLFADTKPGQQTSNETALLSHSRSLGEDIPGLALIVTQAREDIAFEVFFDSEHIAEEEVNRFIDGFISGARQLGRSLHEGASRDIPA